MLCLHLQIIHCCKLKFHMLQVIAFITSFLFSYSTDNCNCCYDMFYKLIHIHKVPSIKRGRDSAVGIATHYGLDGPGIESRCGGEIFRTRPDWPPGLYSPSGPSWPVLGRTLHLPLLYHQLGVLMTFHYAALCKN